ncbi:MAG: hypothetical protein V4587_02960 [Acidobacteriota bacterium]
MAKPFHELCERLLQAGVAPRYVRRYLAELSDHLADLQTEEIRAGRSTADAESASLVRLGSMDDLAKAMIEQRQLQSWCARAPWAVFSLAPAMGLAAAWAIALFILWSGWQIFLPEAATPFGAGHFRLFDLANIYFQFGKAIYFFAPVLIGWGIWILAIRQRTKTWWPTLGMLLLALAASSGHVSATRTAVRGGFPHVRMGLTLDLIQEGPSGFLHMIVVFSVAALPYVAWRVYQAYWQTT